MRHGSRRRCHRTERRRWDGSEGRELGWLLLRPCVRASVWRSSSSSSSSSCCGVCRPRSKQKRDRLRRRSVALSAECHGARVAASRRQLLRLLLNANQANAMNNYSAPTRQRDIVMNVSVCLSVCLSAGLWVYVGTRAYLRDCTSELRQFLGILPVAEARSSSGGVIICYVLPVL